MKSYDTLAQRIAKELTSDTYTEDLIGALLTACLIGLPFAIYFWRMT